MINRFLITTTLVLLYGATSIAKAENGPTLLDHFYLGECLLEKDPLKHKVLLSPTFCINAEASTTLLLRSNAPNQNMTLNLARGYAAIHFGEWVSFHAEARRKRLFLLNNATEGIAADGAITEALFLSLGNQALHRYRINLGKLPMPFGIDFSPTPEIQRVALKTQRYWKYPDYVASFTFDNLVDTNAEVAVASDMIPGYHDPASVNFIDIENRQALSLRLSFDISALEGTRFLLFGYGEKSGQRRFGSGFVNRSGRGDLTSFEWVRWRDTPDGKSHGIQQLFRLNYEGVFVTNTRPIFEYEAEERTYRLLTFGQDYKAFEMGLARLSASYYFDDRDIREPNFWFMNVGLQLEL